jgi:hypothetical protein
MKFRKISFVTITTTFLTIAILTILWPSVNVYATDVHSKDSLTVFCGAKIGVSYDAIKLKPGESKTVGCELDSNVDIKLILWGSCVHAGCHWMQVFYCNHDNWLTIPNEKLLQSDERTDVKCVEP